MKNKLYVTLRVHPDYEGIEMFWQDYTGNGLEYGVYNPREGHSEYCTEYYYQCKPYKGEVPMWVLEYAQCYDNGYPFEVVVRKRMSRSYSKNWTKDNGNN